MPLEGGKAVTIIAEFEAKEGKFEELSNLLREHARLCLEQEEGCLRFEVVHPKARDGTALENKLLMNELYKDEAAVAHHESTSRMLALLPQLIDLAIDIKITYGIVE